MDPFNQLLTIIDHLLIEHNHDINKVENIIINHYHYNNLDEDEQDIVMSTITDKVIMKNKKATEPVIIEEIQFQKQSYSYSSKSFYPPKSFKTDKIEYLDGKIDNTDTKPDYLKYSSKKKIVEPTVFMLDSNGNTVTEGEAMSSKTQAIMLTEITPEQYSKRADIFEKIRAIILPEQRSPEWFAMRNGKITASDGGAVVGKNKHEPQYNFIMKKVFGSTFETGEACYHGKKFEQVVTMMYEYKNDVYTEEFGLLGHPEHYFLGASPDGICSPYKRDKITPTPLVGRMLEIKCPLMRKIKYSGDIKDTICPIYYWCQVQLQLECCDLDECDFVQCNIEEYKTRADWIADTDPNCNFKSKKYGLERGVLIEMLPAKLTEEDYEDGKVKITTVYNQATFLYPPKIDMSLEELDNWLLTQIENMKPTMKLNRVIYWRLIETNCTLILRDKDWFKDNLPTLRTIWGYVEFLRLYPDVAEQWKSFIENQNIKYNEKIIKKLAELIEWKKANLNSTLITYEPVFPEQVEQTKSKTKIKNLINIPTGEPKESKQIEETKQDVKQTLEDKEEIKVKKPRAKAESKTKKTDKEIKEIKEIKDVKEFKTENLATEIPIVNLNQSNQPIPNIKIPDDSDDDIILPNIKRPGKKV